VARRKRRLHHRRGTPPKYHGKVSVENIVPSVTTRARGDGEKWATTKKQGVEDKGHKRESGTGNILKNNSHGVKGGKKKYPK